MAPFCACLNVYGRVYDFFQNPALRPITSIYCNDDDDPAEQRTAMPKAAIFAARTVLDFFVSFLILQLLWLAFFRPYKVRPYVDAAALAAFGVTSGHGRALQYDLALNVTLFNDRHIWGIRFDHLAAQLYYNGTELGPAADPLPSFKLGARRRRTVYPTLRGRAADVGDALVEQLSRQRAQGTLSLDVRVKTTLTYMFWPTRATYYYEYDCWLQFPPPDNSGGAGKPEVTYRGECHSALSL